MAASNDSQRKIFQKKIDNTNLSSLVKMTSSWSTKITLKISKVIKWIFEVTHRKERGNHLVV